MANFNAKDLINRIANKTFAALNILKGNVKSNTTNITANSTAITTETARATAAEATKASKDMTDVLLNSLTNIIADATKANMVLTTDATGKLAFVAKDSLGGGDGLGVPNKNVPSTNYNVEEDALIGICLIDSNLYADSILTMPIQHETFNGPGDYSKYTHLRFDLDATTHKPKNIFQTEIKMRNGQIIEAQKYIIDTDISNGDPAAIQPTYGLTIYKKG